MHLYYALLCTFKLGKHITRGELLWMAAPQRVDHRPVKLLLTSKQQGKTVEAPSTAPII